jgi:hypothetical protein
MPAPLPLPALSTIAVTAAPPAFSTAPSGVKLSSAAASVSTGVAVGLSISSAAAPAALSPAPSTAAAGAPQPSTAAAAAEAPLPPAQGHWAKEANSLLHYGADGELDSETGLGRWDDGNVTRQITAGVAPDKKFAWTLETQNTWNAMRARLLDSSHVLHFFGPEGLELWTESLAQNPEDGPPLAFSSNGETVVVAVHSSKGWSASIRDFTGNELALLGPFPRLEEVAISDNGRYVLARWLVTDQSATHTFYELSTKTQKDIPSEDFYLGAARLSDDGKVTSGGKLLFDFSQSPAPPKNP